MLKPLLSGPRVELNMDRAEHLKLDDLDLDDQTIAVIRERADALIETNA